MRRGEIWVASFNPARGKEVGKSRPCLILQADQLIEHAETVFALPLTTQAPGLANPLRFALPPRDRLRMPCFVMIDHGRALDRTKFTAGPLTSLTASELTAVEQCLLTILGLE